MQIEYERTSSVMSDARVVFEQDSIQWWIETNLRIGYTEEQVKKMQNLLAIIGEQWLIANPQRVDEVAVAIECEGYRHKITHDES